LSLFSAAVRIVTAAPRAMRAPAWLVWLGLAIALAAGPAYGQGAQLTTLEVEHTEQGLQLDFAVRVTLSRAVEEALQRGVALYFVADTRVYRQRWYWRDQRVARASRVWRLSYQPLTSSWRVSQGGLHQSYMSLPEALAPLSRSARWTIATPSQLDSDASHYIEFRWRLDTSQLPPPMQIGIGGQADWQLGVERTLRFE
jgi:hypothetical protein